LWRGDCFAARLSQVTTLCRPDSWNEKTEPKLTAIGALKNVKKGLRPFGDRSVEWSNGTLGNNILDKTGYFR